MHGFRVWAPKVEVLAVKIGDRTYPMREPTRESSDMGYWSATVDEAGPGTDYALLLDEDPTPYPDPRGAWQPQGVHGASRLVDHSAFQWTHASWQVQPLSAAVIYELHIGTVTTEGTFDAAISRLGYLAPPCSTHTELLPIAEFPG